MDPELLVLALRDAATEVRAAARGALASITGIPKDGGYNSKQAQQESWLPLWQAWWEQHRDRPGG